jgi:peptide/nickel transport system permease protein
LSTAVKNFASYVRDDRMTLAGILVVSAVVVMAASAQFLTPFDPTKQDLLSKLLPPSSLHLLGTDSLGRDLLSRIIWGARLSLEIGIIPTILGGFVGTFLGLLSGYYGGRIGAVINASTDVMLSFPYFVLAILIVSVLGPNLTNALLAVAIAMVPSYIRIARVSVLSIKKQYFIHAARSYGANDFRIMFRHILPNVLTPLIVLSTVKLGDSVLAVSSLSFLGLGAQPPTPEWGLMLSEGMNYIFSAPALSLFPGLALIIVVLGIYLIGDGLRDFLDPRFARRLPI